MRPILRPYDGVKYCEARMNSGNCQGHLTDERSSLGVHQRNGIRCSLSLAVLLHNHRKKCVYLRNDKQISFEKSEKPF